MYRADVDDSTLNVTCKYRAAEETYATELQKREGEFRADEGRLQVHRHKQIPVLFRRVKQLFACVL